MNFAVKPRSIAVCCAICLMAIMFLSLYQGSCQTYVVYSVQINNDGSALWIVTSFSDTNGTVDTVSGFQNKVSNLVDSASNVTHREMAFDEISIQVNVTSSQSKTTEYSFLWENFSINQGDQIVFGDVFQAPNFFSQLYGDGALQISYPATFNLTSVTPEPYQNNLLAKTIAWGSQDLVEGKPNVVLTNSPSITTDQNQWQLYAIIGIVVAFGVSSSVVGFYLFRRRKAAQKAATAIPMKSPQLETEEGKILKLLQSSGGSLRQSAIVEQSRFSKAKTSQLLAVLEEKGIITRDKNGSHKIVTLTERVKSEVHDQNN